MVEVKAVGVCGSDVHSYEHGRIGSHIVRQPLLLGHESSGVIIAVGESVDKSRIGERVALEPGIPDGVCLYWLLSISVLKRALMLALLVLFLCSLSIREMT